VINAATSAHIKDIGVTCPFGIAYNLINHNLYAASSGSNQGFVIDSVTNTIVGHLPVGTYPADIVHNPVDHNMYVTNFS
jgi:YVTN family beta-propeller protein